MNVHETTMLTSGLLVVLVDYYNTFVMVTIFVFIIPVTLALKIREYISLVIKDAYYSNWWLASY